MIKAPPWSWWAVLAAASGLTLSLPYVLIVLGDTDWVRGFLTGFIAAVSVYGVVMALHWRR